MKLFAVATLAVVAVFLLAAPQAEAYGGKVSNISSIIYSKFFMEAKDH
jgi:hypothetical protein